jgi:uncharacterized membrane protein YdcZ (DUF606 family)
VNVLVVLFAIVAGVAGSVQVAVMSKLGDRSAFSARSRGRRRWPRSSRSR